MNKSDHSPANEAWLNDALQELTDTTDNMDAALANRLRAARQLAKHEATHKKSWLNDFSIPQWLGASAIACSVALVTFMLLSPQHNNTMGHSKDNIVATVKPNTAPAAISIDVVPMMMAKDELDFYESVDFLLWLEKEKDGIS